MDGPLYSLTDIAQKTGKVKNRKLLRKLTILHRIKTLRVGRDSIYDQAGADALVKAVAEWDARPRLNQLAATA